MEEYLYVVQHIYENGERGKTETMHYSELPLSIQILANEYPDMQLRIQISYDGKNSVSYHRKMK